MAGRPSAWPDGPRVDIVVIYHRASLYVDRKVRMLRLRADGPRDEMTLKRLQMFKSFARANEGPEQSLHVRRIGT